MDKTQTPARGESLLERHVFAVCLLEVDGLDALHGDLSQLRQRFFTEKKTVRTRKKGVFQGYPGKASGKMSPRGLFWRCTAGRHVLEDCLQCPEGTVLVRRNFQDRILSRCYFDPSQRWLRSEYYDSDARRTLLAVYRPKADGPQVEQLIWMPERRCFLLTVLEPVEYLGGRAEQSQVNARLGEPRFLIATDGGDWAYCTAQEAARREQVLEEIRAAGAAPAQDLTEDEVLPAVPPGDDQEVVFAGMYGYARVIAPAAAADAVPETPAEAPAPADSEPEDELIALDALEDEEDTAEVAALDGEPEDELVALDELEDEENTEELAALDGEPEDELVALDELEDEENTEELAELDGESTDELVALDGLEDEGNAEELAALDGEPEDELTALAALEDEEDAAEVAALDGEPEDELAALDGLEDEENAEEVAALDGEPEDELAALDALEDEESTAEMAALDGQPADELVALDALEDEENVEELAELDGEAEEAPQPEPQEPEATPEELLMREINRVLRELAQETPPAPPEAPAEPEPDRAPGDPQDPESREILAQARRLQARQAEWVPEGAETGPEPPETGPGPAPTALAAVPKADGFDDRRYGDGTLSYAGFVKDGKRHGMGVSFRKGDHALHVTGWVDGQPGPVAALFDSDGNLRYGGKIVDGKKQGAGVSLRQADGSVFVGKWKDGEPTGFGSYFDADGDLLYYGQWKDGKRNGRGTQFDKNGHVVFDGLWRDDRYERGALFRTPGNYADTQAIGGPET